jgi:hypothetical protein
MQVIPQLLRKGKRLTNSLTSIMYTSLASYENGFKNELNQEYLKLEEETLQNSIAEADIEFQENNTARAWKVINKVTNRKATTSGKLKGKSPEERNKQWFDHFEKLLGTPDNSEPIDNIDPVFENLDINQQPFTLQGVREAKSSYERESHLVRMVSCLRF